MGQNENALEWYLVERGDFPAPCLGTGNHRDGAPKPYRKILLSSFPFTACADFRKEWLQAMLEVPDHRHEWNIGRGVKRPYVPNNVNAGRRQGAVNLRGSSSTQRPCHGTNCRVKYARDFQLRAIPHSFHWNVFIPKQRYIGRKPCFLITGNASDNDKLMIRLGSCMEELLDNFLLEGKGPAKFLGNIPGYDAYSHEGDSSAPWPTEIIFMTVCLTDFTDADSPICFYVDYLHIFDQVTARLSRLERQASTAISRFSESRFNITLFDRHFAKRPEALPSNEVSIVPGAVCSNECQALPPG
jgi:hypothetical protein